MKKKTGLLFILVLLLCGCICGCKGGEATPTPAGSATQKLTTEAQTDGEMTTPTPTTDPTPTGAEGITPTLAPEPVPTGAVTAEVLPEGAYLVRLTINPDVYFVVDESGKVLGIVAGNEDALDVMNNLEFTGSDIAVVVKEWTDACRQMGYDTAKMEMAVVGADEEEKAEISQLYTELREEHQAEGDAELAVLEEIPEFPTCELCGAAIYSDSKECLSCREVVETELYQCFCGANMRPGQDLCPVCHLYNMSGEYEAGWGPNGREDTSVHCIECDSTNVTYGAYPCVACKGTGIAICFQCGGSGIDYVTAADGGEGWYETCSNCFGKGTWPCQACSNHEPEYGFTCLDCGRTWSEE